MLLLCEDDLCRSPQWFPLRFTAGDSMLLVNLDEDAYRAASFLDERLLESKPPLAACDSSVLANAAAQLRSQPSPSYIFHIGHVGSTLISRLVGMHANLFSVREPAPLRSFAQPTSGPTAIAGTLDLQCWLSLFARTWRAQQRAVIKVTSIVNESAEVILSSIHRPAAIFVYASPLNYLRAILAGPNSRVESRALAPGRMRRLERRMGAVAALDVQSEGEQVAMNWLSEMTTLHQAALRFEAQVLNVDFDEFLQDPVKGLHLILRAFGAESSAGDIESIVAGPIMRQYAKAPEHAYDAALRREVLASADWQHATEIKRGLHWLARVASASPLAQDALATVARRAASGVIAASGVL
jgi:hypothetical protein